MAGIIRIKHKGNFNHIERFFNKVLKKDYLNILANYAEEGLEALRNATPEASGKTAESWGYKIDEKEGEVVVTFTNDNVVNGVNVIILLVYGHGTRNGGYVEGNDFVTPAIRKVFKDLAYTMYMEVTE